MTNLTNCSLKALSKMNQKKARRRNIVPARIGYFALFFMFVYGSILIVLYMIPIEVGKGRFQIKKQKK